MKRIFNILSVLGIVILLIVAIITTDNPLQWIEGLTFFSTGYPKFIITWVGYCMVYLIIIWLTYVIIDKTTYLFKRLNK